MAYINETIEATGTFENDKRNIMEKREKVDSIMKEISETFARIEEAWKDDNDPEGNKFKQASRSAVAELEALNKRYGENDSRLADALTESMKNVNTVEKY